VIIIKIYTRKILRSQITGFYYNYMGVVTTYFSPTALFFYVIHISRITKNMRWVIGGVLIMKSDLYK